MNKIFFDAQMSVLHTSGEMIIFEIFLAPARRAGRRGDVPALRAGLRSPGTPGRQHAGGPPAGQGRQSNAVEQEVGQVIALVHL